MGVGEIRALTVNEGFWWGDMNCFQTVEKRLIFLFPLFKFLICLHASYKTVQ